MFQGSIVALVTPFQKGKVDQDALQNLVSWQCAQGTEGLMICGSTGEGTLLTPQERGLIISLVKEAAGKTPVIVGCGSPSTADVITMAEEAKRLGADGILVVTPYYVKPTQRGLYQHFASVSHAVDIPMIVYNNPGRASVEISVDLLLELSELENVVAIKDSTNDLGRPALMRSRLKRDFKLLCGDDPFTSAYLAQGGDGCISITGNVVPNLCYQLIAAWKNRDLETFGDLTKKLIALHVALVSEVNPCPVKYALSAMGKIQNELRLPLLPATAATMDRVNQALTTMGVL